MKKLIFAASLILIFNLSFAQSPIPEGSKQLNAGFGFSSWGLPIYVGMDFGVHPDISVGGEVSFRSYSNRWNGVSYSHSILGISANGNYHFNSLLEIPTEWDLYAGLNLGFYIWSSPEAYGGTQSSGLGLGIQVGGRYYFSHKLGVNLEFGGGNAFSGGKVGLTIRL